MNRLNDSIMAYRRLEEHIEKSKVPTVIIYYGDHQPTFPLEFSEEAKSRFGSDTLYVTFYRIARNFKAVNSAAEGRYLGLDRLFGEGLAFGGIRLSPELQAKDVILQACKGNASICSDEDRRTLRSLILNPP
jgi:hypothetical protein